MSTVASARPCLISSCLAAMSLVTTLARPPSLTTSASRFRASLLSLITWSRSDWRPDLMKENKAELSLVMSRELCSAGSPTGRKAFFGLRERLLLLLGQDVRQSGNERPRLNGDIGPRIFSARSKNAASSAGSFAVFPTEAKSSR